MYQFCTTERNNSKANEYETKSMLYLLSYRKDSNEIDTFLIDCFNDVTGVSTDVTKLWDVQSKNVKSLNPMKIGIALITLFQNYISSITFNHYILFMPKLTKMYLNDETLSVYFFDNFIDKYQSKVIDGLEKEYLRRNGVAANPNSISTFLEKVTFVNAADDKVEYIKNIVKFKNLVTIDDAFFVAIFDEIRDKQTKLKNIDIEGKQVGCAKEALAFEKVIHRSEIDTLIINRFVGVDLFSNRMIPNLFFDEVKDYDLEQRKDIIQECNASISKIIFNKNNKKIFWNFFENTIFLVKKNARMSPREIFDELKKKKIRFPASLDELSTIYLISILKECLDNEH
ncbi:MAG TPA: hypothetical protein VIR55_07750 [Ignavibacteria bacterium]